MEEIDKVITEIERKIGNMKSSLSVVKTENKDLKSELQLLYGKLEQRELEAIDFKKKYEELKSQREQKTENFSNKIENKDVQIDALVREIDDCINRLKV